MWSNELHTALLVTFAVQETGHGPADFCLPWNNPLLPGSSVKIKQAGE
jgi:hypothetical protein